MPVDFADYHRIALLTGCESIDDVISWADKEIGLRDNPEPELIDVSLGKTRTIKQIHELLTTLVVDLNDSSALKCVLDHISTLVRDGRLAVDDAIDRIYNYARSSCPTTDLRYAFISLAEDLSCIRDGVYYTDAVAALREPLLETINRFCGTQRDENDITRR